jgi:hypothetical protein
MNLDEIGLNECSILDDDVNWENKNLGEWQVARFWATNSGIEDPAICFLHSDEPHSWNFSYPSLGCEDLKTIGILTLEIHWRPGVPYAW